MVILLELKEGIGTIMVYAPIESSLKIPKINRGVSCGNNKYMNPVSQLGKLQNNTVDVTPYAALYFHHARLQQ